MRVLQLVSRDDVGGVRVLTELIGKGLEDKGVTVQTLALIGGTGFGRIGHTLHVLGRLATGRYDAVLAYQAAASVAAGTVGAFVGVPHRLSHLTAIPSAIRPHWRLLDRLIGAAGGYTTIVANSTATAKAFADYTSPYRERLCLIPHGVAPLPGANSIDWRRRLGIEPEHKLLVASGRLTAQKDFATAVRALADLPNAELAIAGDGEQRAMLLALADESDVGSRLHLVGSLPREELGAFLSAGDCYLFPSVWETFGLAGVEAQMLGLPVVASDLPVLREVLQPTQLLGFHAPGNASSLATAVREMTAVPVDTQVRLATTQAAMAQHSVATMVRRYLELLVPAGEAVLQN